MRFRRWRALRGVPHLTRDAREGSRVQATGIARALSTDDPFVPPISGVPCVLGWTKLHGSPEVNKRSQRVVLVERMHIRPFTLTTADQELLVDTSHVELVFPIQIEGRVHEISVADGQRVTIIGTVLRDGIELPDDTLAFRDARATCKLVGSKAHPIVITHAA